MFKELMPVPQSLQKIDKLHFLKLVIILIPKPKDQRLNCKHETISLKTKTGENLKDLNTRYGFLILTPKYDSMKGKKEQIKILKFCSVKDS